MSLASSVPGDTLSPSTVTIPDGSNSATFTVNASTAASRSITATSSGLTAAPGMAYAASYPPALTLVESGTTAVDGGASVNLTATPTNSSAAISASVSGGGAISTRSPASGVPFTYNPPGTGTGTGTAVVTVVDATDNLTRTASIGYAPGPVMTLAPANAVTGTAGSIAVTGTRTAWTSATTFWVAGGTGAAISGVVVNVGAQTVTLNLDPGSAPGTLTIADSTDGATAVVAVAVPPDFSLSCPASAAASPGGSANVALALAEVGGYAGFAALGVTGLPAGVTGSFSPASRVSAN